jgi:hypothetical protein
LNHKGFIITNILPSIDRREECLLKDVFRLKHLGKVLFIKFLPSLPPDIIGTVARIDFSYLPIE